MKRKESKIPLLLTMIVLGYFAFWMIGYVRRNKPQPDPGQPVAQMAKPANATDTRVQEMSPELSRPQQPGVEQAPVVKAPPQGSVDPTLVTGNAEEPVLTGRTQNRKLAGVLDSTVKH